MDNFTLVAERIECLHLKDCALEVFGFAGRGTLKQLKTDDVSVLYLHIAETAENLETVDIRNFSLICQCFYKMTQDYQEDFAFLGYGALRGS